MEDKISKYKKQSNWSYIPWIILEHIAIYLDLKDILMCQLTCKNWLVYFAQSNSYIWKFHCQRLLTEEALLSEFLPQFTSWKSKLKIFYNSWNPDDCSKNIYVKKDGFTLHRKPVARSSDGIRGKIGYKSGRHCWEIWWLGPLGTVASVGVVSKSTSLHYQGGYLSLLGRDDCSWGWNIVDNMLHCNGKCEKLADPTVKYKIGERIRMILDCEERILTFEKSIDSIEASTPNTAETNDHNFSKIGILFTNVHCHGKPLYPAVSAVYGHSEVCMIYIGAPVDG